MRDSRVSEHLDTKFVVNLRSLLRHNTVIFVKWRPSGRSNNRHAAEPALPSNIRSRDPVSFGEVKGGSHSPTSSSEEMKTNVRSSRGGKEQIRLKISKEVKVRRSDLTVGDNLWNGMRETWYSFQLRHSRRKCMTLLKVLIQPPTSISAAVTTGRPRMERLRVW